VSAATRQPAKTQRREHAGRQNQFGDGKGDRTQSAAERRRWTEGLRILPVAGTYGPDDYLTVDDRDLLERAFRRLTLEQRAVLVFHHYLGLSISEVAVRTDLPVGTAKSRLHHATRALKASIEADARSTADSQERLA